MLNACYVERYFFQSYLRDHVFSPQNRKPIGPLLMWPTVFFAYDCHICSLENFSMCLWTPYKGVLGWLKFVRGGCKKLKI